jgi:hypothetical protein
MTTNVSTVYDIGEKNEKTTVSKVYTLGMKKVVYVKVKDEQAIKIFADKVEESGNGTDAILTLTRAGEFVGKFHAFSVQGWWIADESV